MGVDWYSCPICGEAFNDCGHYGWCICGERLCGYCYDEMVKKHGIIGEDHEEADNYGECAVPKCDSCDETMLNDFNLLEFALKKLNISRNQLEEEFKNTYK